MNIKKVLCIVIIISFVSCNHSTDIEDSAIYTVTFTSSWSTETHPYEFPSNAHFSGLVGATHNDETYFWKEDTIASDGIKSMSETGNKDTLIGEINLSISDDLAYEVISKDGLSETPANMNFQLNIDVNYPLVTLVSMIAPSPDWFIGVSGLNLIKNGKWVENLTYDLYAFDAGTDSGISYTSSNSITNPYNNISKIKNEYFNYEGNNPIIGTFKFVKN